MEAVPFTRIAGVLPLVRCLEQAGMPVERLAHRAGVPSRLFDQPEAAIPMHLACRFYGLAARSLGCPSLGAEIGRRTETWSMGSYGAVLRGCRTLDEGLRTAVAKVRQFATGHRDWLVEEGDRVWLAMGLVGSIGLGRRQVEAFVLTMTIATLRSVLGPEWTPSALRVPDHGRSWTDALGLDTRIEVRAGQDHVAVAIPRALLPAPIPAVPLPSAEAVRRQLAESAPPETFVESVCLAIRSLLAEQRPHVELVAAAAGWSPRTLQRRLAEAGWTFSGLLDRCRMERARELLARSELRAIDVAYELGYHDPANFTRAFRRWSGVTPRDYRRHVSGLA
jgi:AraC-like DNA-binding protein